MSRWLGVLAVAWGWIAAADPPRAHEVDLGLDLGWGAPFPGADVDRIGGVATRLTLRYRSPDGLGAFVAAGWMPIYSDRSEADDGSGRLRALDNRLEAWHATGGLLAEWGPMRVSLGLGLRVHALRSTLGEAAIRTTLTGLAYDLGVEWLSPGWTRLTLGPRVIVASGTEDVWLLVTVGISGLLFAR